MERRISTIAVPRASRVALTVAAALLSAVYWLGGAGSALAAGTFYVDGADLACSNTGPGTEATPYCTITAAAAARGGPGTTILVKPAIYREQVNVPASGAAGSPFVLRALGAPVVVDGADDFASPAQWTSPFANTVYLAATVTWVPKQVFADGARLTPSTAEPAALPPGTFRHVLNEGLYVNLGGDTPGDHQTLVGRRANGFQLPVGGRPFVTIDGFTVTRTDDRGIHARALSHNTTITNNTVTFANQSNIQVEGSANVLIGSNVVSDSNNHGIHLSSGVTGSTIQDNESFRNARPGVVRAANGIHLSASSGNLVQRNRVHDNEDSGIQINAASNNVISLQNRSWNNGDHGFDHLMSTGTLHVGDVASENFNEGFSVEGSATGTRIFNSIGVNNGLTTGSFNLFVDATSAAASDIASNYNIFWNATPQAPIRYITTNYATITAFTAATGHDANSLQTDPRFVDPAGGDFHLLAGSPAIDAADSTVPSWPATDAEERDREDDPATPNTGAGPVDFADRGALEFLPVAAPNQAPNGVIDTPTGPVTIVAGQSVSFTGTGTDPDNTLPLAFLWNFGGGAPNSILEDPGAVVFSTPGIYTVTFTVTDSQPLADPTPDSRVITVNASNPTSNLLTNGGFEEGQVGWTNWSSSSRFVTTLSPYAGAFALQINAGSSNRYIHQTIPATAGVSYTVSFALRTALTAGVARVKIHFLDSAGAAIGSVHVSDTTGTTPWTVQTTTQTAPAGTVQVRIYCWVTKPGSGSAWFDEVGVR